MTEKKIGTKRTSTSAWVISIFCGAGIGAVLGLIAYNQQWLG
ncbi:hypothetical protein [Caryophanon tenue]|nr:hypothetical protein [Caryophanon tenue]